MQPLSHNVPSRLAGTLGNVNSQSRPRGPLRMPGLAILVLAVQFAASPLRVFSQLVPLKSISTLAGNGTPGFSGDGGPATQAQLGGQDAGLGFALDSAGNLYFADSDNNRIRVVTASGVITTFLGNGTAGFAGDGGALSTVEFNFPVGLAMDKAGNLYISDLGNLRVRKFSVATQTVTTIAGTGLYGYSGDGGPATAAALSYPRQLALDGAGNLYIADPSANVIREVNAATGIITTVCGRGFRGFGGDGGPAAGATLNQPYGVALDSQGNIYIADTDNYRIRKIDAATGNIATIAGTGSAGFSGDGGAAANAELSDVIELTLDGSDNLYIPDVGENRVRMVSPSTGIITTVAGNGTMGYSGDGAPAIDAELNEPTTVITDRFGNLYVADSSNNVIREVSPFTPANTNVGASSAPQNLYLQTTAAETITGFTVPASQGGKQEYTVGMVTGCAVDGTTSNPAGTICTVPITFSPAYPGLRPVPLQAVTSGGNINLGLNGMGVAPQAAMTPGTISTLAGEPNTPNCNAYNGPALQGPICNPIVGAVDAAGNVYVVAYYSNTVSKVDTQGNITVIAGTGAGGVSGIGGPATSAEISTPSDVAVDAAGNVYFSDAQDQYIFRIDALTQDITIVAGNGSQGYSGDNGPATMASLNYPQGVALDTQGNLYFEDQDNNLIRKIDASGVITTVAGNPATAGQGSTAFSGDGGQATQANLSLCCHTGIYAAYDAVTVDAAGDLFIGDSGHHVVREVTPDGIIHTVAGNNSLGGGYNGDGGAATSAQLNWPMGVAVDPGGDLYIADFANDRIRKVDAATQTISTVAGRGAAGFGGDGGPATQASLNGPQKVVLDGAGNLYIADTKNNLVRKTDVSKPMLTFATPTMVGSTDTADGTLRAAISNIGNAPLTIPVPSAGTNPSISTSFSLSSSESGACPELSSSSAAATLAVGSSCALAVNFAPATAGHISGSLVLTDNSLNASSPYATQTISLIGAGLTQPVLTPATMDFSNVTIGTVSAAQTATLQNNGVTALPVSFGVTGSNPGGFSYSDNCGSSLAAGASCSISISCVPAIVETLTASFNVSFASLFPQQSIALTCNAIAVPAPQAALTPATANFGSVASGSTSAAQTFTLVNAGNASLTIASVGLGGTNSGSFQISGNTCGSSLAANGSCTVAVTFSPAAAGSYSASLSIVDAVGTQSAVLSGTGTSPGAALAPASLSFTATAGGPAAASQTATLTNAGSAALSVSSIAITGANASSFTQTNNCGATLAVNASCTITVSFTGTAAGSYAASLVATDNATPATQSTSLTGIVTAPVAALTPASLSFTTVAGTAPAAQTATLTNSGNAALAIASIAITGANAASFTQTNTCGASLAAGASCAVTVSFAGTAAGSYAAALTVTDNSATPTQTAALSGAVTAAPAPVAALTPATLTYSAAAGGASAAQTATLTNSGNAALSISGITLTGANAASFTQTNNCGASLAAGASCAISVTFTPGSAGSFTAALSVADNAAGSPQTSALAGTATSPADFTVAATPATQSVAAGGAAAYTVQVASTGGSFTNAVALTAAGLPSGATVTFAPASVTPGAAGGQSTMTVQTAAAQTASLRESSRGRFSGTLAAPVFAAVLLLIPGWRARRRWRSKAGRGYFTGAGCLLVLLGMMAAITGCGGGFALPQSPAATYTITVTGTSGPVQHTTTVQITVR